MTFSILAGLLVLLLIAVIFYGYGFVVKSATRPPGRDREPCVICARYFSKQQLVERALGGGRLLYFCKSCIAELQKDSAHIT